MADRKLSALIVGVAMLLGGSILWDAIGAVTRHVRHANAVLRPATAPERGAGAVAAAASPTPPAPAPAAQPAPWAAPSLSYIEQLARADARRRLRASTDYTYLGEIVAESADSALHRWDGRAATPVRVYLGPGTVPNFQAAFLPAVRSAFQRWEQAGVPVRFDLDADSDHAEVRFHWTERFDIERTGQTDVSWDGEGRIQRAVITIATFDPRWHALSPDDVRVVALHEVGHLLGLDHSTDSTDIMFAQTRVRDLSSRDIRTALMLYEFAPGSVR